MPLVKLMCHCGAEHRDHDTKTGRCERSDCASFRGYKVILLAPRLEYGHMPYIPDLITH